MILSGWKEIAAHLNRGVRTVQRWEAMGLPICRAQGAKRTAVSAFSEDLDAWLNAPKVTGGSALELQRRLAELEQENSDLRLALTTLLLHNAVVTSKSWLRAAKSQAA